MTLAILLSLLVAVFLPLASAPAAPQVSKQAEPAKARTPAGKRLQRQRERLQRQRRRLQKKRQRFLKNQQLERKKLTAERKKLEEEEQSTDDGDTGIWSGFFPWLNDGDFSDNWLTGLGLAAIGVAGSLILVFGLLGSLLPSMGGKAEYEALLLEIEQLSKRRNNQLEPRERFVRSEAELESERRQEATNLTHDLNGIIQGKEEEARRTYRRLMTLGIPLYILIGGALAVLLASNALQALAIGFAWTSVVDRLGLKRELTEKKEIKKDSADALATTAKEGELAKSKLVAKEAEIQEVDKALAKQLSPEQFHEVKSELLETVEIPTESQHEDPVRLEQIEASAAMIRDL